MATKDLQAAPASLHDVVGQVAAEVAAPLTRALERIRALQCNAGADAEQLRALHDEVAQARRIGILGQQIARLASGTVRQVLEPVDLHDMLRELLEERRRDVPAARLLLHEKLEAATIIADSGLLGALMLSAIDWCSHSTAAPIDLVLQARPATMQAVLRYRFVRRATAGGNEQPLSWHLMHFAAAPLGAQLHLEDGGEHATLRITIDRLVPQSLPGEASAADMRQLAAASCWWCPTTVTSATRCVARSRDWTSWSTTSPRWTPPATTVMRACRRRWSMRRPWRAPR
jgi:hypothetical protein